MNTQSQKSLHVDRPRSTRTPGCSRVTSSPTPEQTLLDSRVFRGKRHCLRNPSANTAKSCRRWGCDENSQVKHVKDGDVGLTSRLNARLHQSGTCRPFQAAGPSRNTAGDGTDTAPERGAASIRLRQDRSSMSLLDFVKYAYAAMVVCVLCLEITRSSRLARRWAQMAIVLATLGGSTWVYAAHINRTPFDEDGWRVPPRHAGSNP